MINVTNFKNVAVLCDFDGTITTFDTNNKLMDIYGDKKYNNKVNKSLDGGHITLRQAAKLSFRQLNIDEKTYLNFMLNKVQLQNGFLQFYKNIKKYNVHFGILSGGFKNGIIPFLNKHKIRDVKVYANELVFEDNKISINFLAPYNYMSLQDDKCFENIKVKVYKQYKKRYNKVIFIGDGFTDFEIAKKADILFAKDYLEKYCIDSNIKFIKWKDFNDINQILFEGDA